MSRMQNRTSWQVTKSVWHALFMREVLSRLFANRFAWFWLFAEPVLLVMIMVGIRTFIRMMDSIAGIEMIPWMIVGLSTFFVFRSGMTRGMGAINANKGLFAYRQVKTVDTVFVRVFVEGLLYAILLIVFILGLALMGYDMHPQNVIGVMIAWLSVWALGLAAGMVLSVVTSIIEEVGKIVKMISLPLMILSGAFIPVQYMPHQIKEILLYNPILHGIESLRLAFFEGYWSVHGIDLFYLQQWVLGLLLVGLALHIRFEAKLKAN